MLWETQIPFILSFFQRAIIWNDNVNTMEASVL